VRDRWVISVAWERAISSRGFKGKLIREQPIGTAILLIGRIGLIKR
jgi:hypothetical protein